MKKVLVTGANGFIGSHMLRYVSELEGYYGIGWGRTDADGVRSVNFELRDNLISELKALKPDIIIHCAGLADVGKSFDDPQKDFESNVTCTHNLLYAIKEAQLCPKVLFLSSAAVYGNPPKLPVEECTARNPMSPYALHKMMAEDICLFFNRHYNIPIKTARIFSAYGRGLKKQIFWDMNKKLNETRKISLFGTGNETRDYIHIDDLVKALMLIVTSDTDDLVFNVANGEAIKIGMAAETFAKAKGQDTSVIEFNGIIREGDPLFWQADITKLKQLGYKQDVSFSDGIRDYVCWLEGDAPENCR